MERNIKRFSFFLAVITFPIYCLAADRLRGVSFFTHLFDYINFALAITCLISIKQYFWPGDEDRTVFHIFNIIFIILFYTVGISFLINNRQYYDGYQQLNAWGCIREFFFGSGIDKYQQWIVVFGLVINVLYINRSLKSVI